MGKWFLINVTYRSTRTLSNNQVKNSKRLNADNASANKLASEINREINV